MPTGYYIGTSGWHYDHCRGDFYPVGLAKTGWLGFYASQFPTVELNNSFYQLPSEKAFASWKNATPPGFVFSVKVNRFITHIKRLRETGEATAKSISRARILGDRLGPLLYQLPPSMKYDAGVLEDFLKTLSSDCRHVFEFRHISWFNPGTYELLDKYHSGFCVYDMPGLVTPAMVTSDFAYVRFHGNRELYISGYSDEEMGEWAGKIKSLAVNTVYIYFNNDAGGFAIKNALKLASLLGLTGNLAQFRMLD
jgi:uncharacterized protein YecE (DUF72 family)